MCNLLWSTPTVCWNSTSLLTPHLSLQSFAFWCASIFQHTMENILQYLPKIVFKLITFYSLERLSSYIVVQTSLTLFGNLICMITLRFKVKVNTNKWTKMLITKTVLLSCIRSHYVSRGLAERYFVC